MINLRVFVNKKLSQYQSEAFWLQIVYGGEEINLDLAYEFVKDSKLILVIKGSGGIADLIADAMADLSSIKSDFQEIQNAKVKEMITNYTNQIIIYDLQDTSIGIDEQISTAIALKEKNLYRKVLFSMIFTTDSIDECEFARISDLKEIKTILKTFLKRNNFEILKVLMPKVENLDQIFEKEDLKDLYETSIIFELVKSKNGSQSILKKHYYSMVSDMFKHKTKISDEKGKTIEMKLTEFITSKDLFLWALRSGFHEIGRTIWENSNDPVELALFGSINLNEIANEYKKKGFALLSENYFKESEYYQNISKEIIMEAYEKDCKASVKILLKPTNVIKNKSLLQIAIREKFVAFCNQSACQHFLNIAWKYGDLSNLDQEKENRTQYLKKRLQSPESKYYLHLISYIIFLMIFTYFNLVELDIFNLFDIKRVICEITIYAFIVGFMLQEIQEIFNESTYGSTSRIYNYYKGLGNQFDMVALLMSLCSFILRCTVSNDKFMIIRSFYSMTLSISFVKIMYFYLYMPVIGHKVIMIHRMIKDILFFLLIFLIFILAYGTLLQSLQNPNSSFDWNLIKDIFYRPYFQVYGELMMDSFKIPSPCNTSSCIVQNSTMLIGFAIFLLLTNILLINLLIAMFNYTFQKDVENRFSILSIQLLHEYYNKSIFPSPLVYISFLIWLFPFLKNKINNINSVFNSILIKKYDDYEMKRILAFEKWCADSVLRRKCQIPGIQMKINLRKQIKKLNEKQQLMEKNLEYIKRKL